MLPPKIRQQPMQIKRETGSTVNIYLLFTQKAITSLVNLGFVTCWRAMNLCESNEKLEVH